MIGESQGLAYGHLIERRNWPKAVCLGRRISGTRSNAERPERLDEYYGTVLAPLFAAKFSCTPGIAVDLSESRSVVECLLSSFQARSGIQNLQLFKVSPSRTADNWAAMTFVLFVL